MNPFTGTTAPHRHHELGMLPDTGGTTKPYSKYGAAGRLRFAELSRENAGINRANAALSEGAQRERKQVHAFGLDRHHKRSFRHQWALYYGLRPTLDTLTAGLPRFQKDGAFADEATASDAYSPGAERLTPSPAYHPAHHPRAPLANWRPPPGLSLMAAVRRTP